MSVSIRVPFHISASGYVDATSSLGDHIRNAVLAGVATRNGERMMSGDLGSRVPDLILDPMAFTFELAPEDFIQQEAFKSLDSTYGDSVEISGVEVTESSEEMGEYHVLVTYTTGGADVELTAEVTVGHDLLEAASSGVLMYDVSLYDTTP